MAEFSRKMVSPSVLPIADGTVSDATVIKT